MPYRQNNTNHPDKLMEPSLLSILFVILSTASLQVIVPATDTAFSSSYTNLLSGVRFGLNTQERHRTNVFLSLTHRTRVC